MNVAFNVVDGFCEHAAGVRQSALDSGFATWRPKAGEVGSSIYDGMNFKGAHGVMLRSLSAAMGGAHIFPNSMFFRVTTPETERAYIHSDRSDGSFTCIAYLSEHPDQISGTAFYRHRRTGWREMPPLEEMQKAGVLEPMKRDMVYGGDSEWEQLDFVRGIFNRALLFHAPLFHSRIPMHGIGDGDPESARMVWVAHFDV